MIRERLTQGIVLLAGLFYTLSAVTMLAAPVWFYTNIGDFPPYNRHYIGDVAAFLLPLGVGLMIAARQPAHYRALIGVAAAGGLIHALNHAWDALHGIENVWEAAQLTVFALLLIAAYPGRDRNERARPHSAAAEQAAGR